MCEPYHSITQYPPHDDDGNPTDSRVKALAQQTGFVKKWFKKIKGFFHLSKMGAGHSESVGRITPAGRLYLPNTILYEGAWWDRKFMFDGSHGLRSKVDMIEARECAEHYFQMVCAGNIQTLRRFLETSMDRTEYPNAYENEFVYGFLNQKGRSKFARASHLPRTLKQRIKYLLGFTRKRELIVPEWADLNELWLPGQRAETA